MSRSTHRLKPPSKAAIQAAIKSAGDNCSLCQRPLSHGEKTTSGYVGHSRRLEIAGRCCAGRLATVWGVGLYLDPGQIEAPHMRDDREWFAANPARAHRLRPAYPVEQVSACGGRPATWVAVRQIEPGMRFKAGFIPPGPMPDVEALGHAVFDLVTESAKTGETHVSTADIYERAMRMATGGRA